MAVVRVKTGHTTKREKQGALLLLLFVAVGSWIGGGLVAPMRYQAQLDRLDLSPGSVGSPADHSAPEVSTLAEMQANERFILVNEEFGDWQRSTGGMIGDTYYNKVTLADGTVLAARINYDAQQNQYVLNEEDPYALSEHTLVTYPIGTLRPWPAGDPGTVDWITYRDGYLDMLGDFGAEPPDREKLRENTFLIGAAAGLVLGGIFTTALLLRGDKKDRLASTPRNDLERWILGSYAIWAQFFGQLDYKGRLKNPNTPQSPLYFGGRPKDDDSKKFTRKTLKNSWDIKDLRGLLETVEYMSRGPGLQNCQTQADRAWELCRSTQLLGMGFIAGWLTREEMIERSCTVGRIIQAHFQSWEELSQRYLEAYEAWSLQNGQSSGAADMRRRIYDNLCQRTDSPYRLHWGLQLDAAAWAGRAQLEQEIAR